MRAAEVLPDEAAAVFGEDVALPEVRVTVFWLRDEMTALQRKLNWGYQQEVDLVEPDEEELSIMRKIAGWSRDRTGTQAGDQRHAVACLFWLAVPPMVSSAPRDLLCRLGGRWCLRSAFRSIAIGGAASQQGLLHLT